MEWRAGMETLSPSTINGPALGGAQAGGRSQARRHDPAGGGGQPDRKWNGDRLGSSSFRDDDQSGTIGAARALSSWQ